MTTDQERILGISAVAVVGAGAIWWATRPKVESIEEPEWIQTATPTPPPDDFIPGPGDPGYVPQFQGGPYVPSPKPSFPPPNIPFDPPTLSPVQGTGQIGNIGSRGSFAKFRPRSVIRRRS